MWVIGNAWVSQLVKQVRQTRGSWYSLKYLNSSPNGTHCWKSRLFWSDGIRKCISQVAQYVASLAQKLTTIKTTHVYFKVFFGSRNFRHSFTGPPAQSHSAVKVLALGWLSLGLNYLWKICFQVKSGCLQNMFSLWGKESCFCTDQLKTTFWNQWRNHHQLSGVSSTFDCGIWDFLASIIMWALQ